MHRSSLLQPIREEAEGLPGQSALSIGSHAQNGTEKRSCQHWTNQGAGKALGDLTGMGLRARPLAGISLQRKVPSLEGRAELRPQLPLPHNSPQLNDRQTQLNCFVSSPAPSAGRARRHCRRAPTQHSGRGPPPGTSNFLGWFLVGAEQGVAGVSGACSRERRLARVLSPPRDLSAGGI